MDFVGHGGAFLMCLWSFVKLCEAFVEHGGALWSMERIRGEYVDRLQSVCGALWSICGVVVECSELRSRLWIYSMSCENDQV